MPARSMWQHATPCDARAPSLARNLESHPASCHAGSVGGPDPNAKELRAVAPLIAIGATGRHLVGTALVVRNGPRVIAVSSAELLRPFNGQSLAIVHRFASDAKDATTPVATWGIGRYAGVAMIELGGRLPTELSATVTDVDVEPLDIASVCASVDTRGAPTAIAFIGNSPTGFERTLIPVHIDGDDAGGMLDRTMYLASPHDRAHSAFPVEGAPVFTWFAPDVVLGRPSEVLAVALAYPYRAKTAKPRDTPVIAELVGLDDVGRVLLSTAEPPEPQPRELAQVSGEIKR